MTCPPAGPRTCPPAHLGSKLLRFRLTAKCKGDVSIRIRLKEEQAVRRAFFDALEFLCPGRRAPRPRAAARARAAAEPDEQQHAVQRGEHGEPTAQCGTAITRTSSSLSKIINLMMDFYGFLIIFLMLNL